MDGDPLQRRADVLAARVDALAAALNASGVAEGTAARLLSQASEAVLQALTLELLLEQQVQALDAAPGPHPRLQLAVRLAA
jgi:hypothetical protein